jgi:hypothetical protein
MKIYITALAVSLTACATQPGTGKDAAMDADWDICKSTAVLLYPVKEVQRIAYTTSSTQYTSTTRPEVVDLDLNRNKRIAAIEQCMFRRGWTYAPFVGWHRS